MLSPDTQNLLARILLALAEGERSVEDARKEISIEDSYDIQAIFKVLDNNGDNYITPKDVQKYLNAHDLEVNFMEVKLLILFYDQDHDFSLTYGEIFKMIHPGKEMPKIPKYKNDEELNVKVDRKLYNLLEKEILMARSVLALLEEIKHKRDFNIHSAFHALKYYACITGDSINIYLKNCGMSPTAGDIRAIVKRLDINKDDIIDFCEFHAFLGYPDCSFCCPCFPCPNCGIKYCNDCLQDIPCYLLGCDHKGMDSKMKCTSPEHNPQAGGFSSIISSTLSPGSMRKSRYSPKFEDNEEFQKGKFFSKTKKGGGGRNINFYEDGNNQPGINNMQTGQFFTPSRNGYNRGNISQEQFKLLQGLTNPEQLNKFMTINRIIDRQNSEEINLTDNLSLRLSPIRDFDPKDWGCRNCPCNFHSNPNVSCDCCTCDICPFKITKESKTGKQKQILFPRVTLYSYSYSYEPDNSGPNMSTLATSYGLGNSLYVNSPKRKKVYFDREVNRYKKTMPNSSDDEQDYDEYMNKVINIRDKFDSHKKKIMEDYNPSNSMIYNDEMSKTENPNMRNNINDINDEEENQDNNIEMEQNIEENINDEENIVKQKLLMQKMYKKGKDIHNQDINKKTKVISKKIRSPNENVIDNEDENIAQDEMQNENNIIPEQDQDPNQIQTFNNNKGQNNNLNPNFQSNQNPNQFPNSNNIQNNMPNNMPNNFPNNIQNNIPNKIQGNIPNNETGYMSKTFPNDINNQNYNDNMNPFGSTTKTIFKTFYSPKNNINNNNRNNFVSGIMEEESEDDLSNRNNLFKSREETIDENEKIFIQYLHALIKSEKEIEFAKRDLMRQDDFNAEDAFRFFEREGTKLVTKEDLIFGLKLLGIKPTNNQITIIFNKYDLNGNDFLDYDDFFDMVISFKHSDRKIEEKRKPNRSIKNRRLELFSQRTRELYKKLFLVIIEEEERLENLKQKLNINDELLNEIFKKINIDRDGICDKNEFVNYCLRKKICKEKKDAYLAFIRLNRNRDGGLESKEFSIELKSSILGK